MVKVKYNRRVAMEATAAHDLPPSAAARGVHLGCPMLDGSMAQYISAWAGSNQGETAGEQGMTPGPLVNMEGHQVLPDCLATVVMEWSSR